MSKKKTATKATATKAQNKRLGDAVESIAKPIAKTIDKALGTDLEHCEACERRKNFLNNFQDKFSSWFSRPHRQPTEQHLEVIDSYFERGHEVVNHYWQATLLPIHNYIYYRNDRPTSCPPCWQKVEDRLRLIHDQYNEA